MYPSSKNYLAKAGYRPSAVGWIILGCFVAGFVFIQVLSRFLHEYVPSQVVDCDHSHGDKHTSSCAGDEEATQQQAHSNGHHTESTPLLNNDHGYDGAQQSKSKRKRKASPSGDEAERPPMNGSRRPSMVEVQKRVMSFVKDTRNNCDEEGPCFGYSGPCGHGCLNYLNSRTGSIRHQSVSHPPDLMRTAAENHTRKQLRKERKRARKANAAIPSSVVEEDVDTTASEAETSVSPRTASFARSRSRKPDRDVSFDEDPETQHHHHVAENPFLSIGLQTSIAIALHKLPEGFITYATNHANPDLGFTVFVALFIHNITEGFAMALPLFLALKSRMRAMFWASLLGGISQPLGAGIAALWFKLAQHTDHLPGFAMYGCMFAATAGIMTSVAIQLFTESLSLNHNANLVAAFALIGMAIMGCSSALTADH
jgi:ZIP family zinc transporter